MSVRFKKVQNKMKNSKTFNYWYGRAVTLGSVSTKDLAEELSHATTVTRADIMAVLIELSVAIQRHLLNSQSVHLDGLGSFRVGIKSTPTEKKEDFKASKIKSFHIIYTPERSAIAAGTNEDGSNRKVYVKDLLSGVTAEEMPTDEGKKDAGETTDTGSEANTEG